MAIFNSKLLYYQRVLNSTLVFAGQIPSMVCWSNPLPERHHAWAHWSPLWLEKSDSWGLTIHDVNDVNDFNGYVNDVNDVNDFNGYVFNGYVNDVNDVNDFNG